MDITFHHRLLKECAEPAEVEDELLEAVRGLLEGTRRALEEEELRCKEVQRPRMKKFLSTFQNLASSLQETRSWMEESPSWMEEPPSRLKILSRLATALSPMKESCNVHMLKVDDRVGSYDSYLQELLDRDEQELRWLEGDLSMLEENLGWLRGLEEDWSMLEKVIWAEELQLLMIRAMSIFGVSLGSGRMNHPMALLIRLGGVEAEFLNDRLKILRGKSIFGENLVSGSVERPELMPNKPSLPASDVETPPCAPDEIRDHNEKLMNSSVPQITEHVKSALLPVLGPVAAALQDERKHQEKVLELEERQLALKIRLKRRGVGRSQRRRRASSARRWRPRTRQLGPRLKFPWKRQSM